jgi:uncharacterized membrane protein YfcA
MSPLDSILLLLLGGAAGVLAGFLGIGGGIVIVPGLIFLFRKEGVNPEILTHLAVGTSLATIAATGLSSAVSHHRHQNVRWPVALSMAPFVILGTLVGSAWAASLHGVTLRRLFGFFELAVAVRMAVVMNPKSGPPRLPLTVVYGIGGLIVGSISALFGIGGGTISVPVMVFFLGIPIKPAVGTSAAEGVVIAVFGALAYLYQGWRNAALPAGTLGFIAVLPAILIGATSVIGAPFGARLNRVVSPEKVSLGFALLLAAVGIKLILD